MTNIIADIAGQYKTLIALVDQMPEGEIISLGDMVDRGPDSKRVLDFFMKEGRRAIFGNHEHMMVDFHRGSRYYQDGIWHMNGGSKTLESFPNYLVSEEYIVWLESLPRYIEIDDTLLSHAFLPPCREGLSERNLLRDACDFGVNARTRKPTIIWSRREPTRKEAWSLQIAGHNSQFGLRRWSDSEGTFALCLDDCRKKKLTGYHLESGTVYQQDYIE